MYVNWLGMSYFMQRLMSRYWPIKTRSKFHNPEKYLIDLEEYSGRLSCLYIASTELNCLIKE